MNAVRAAYRRLDNSVKAEPRNDPSMLVGMQSAAALLVAYGVVALGAVLAIFSSSIKNYGLLLVPILVIAAAVTLLVVAPGAPMNWPATLSVMVLLPLAIVLCPLGMESEEASGFALGVINGLASVTASYLCVRGRTLMALITVLLFVPAAHLAEELARESLGAVTDYLLQNVAVVAMAGVFALVAQPMADNIFALRRQTEAEQAQEAAERAIVSERDEQLARLDSAARPLLIKLLDGNGLDAEDRRQARLVEARLRDEIRARALRDPRLADAVWAARDRDVNVILLDDSLEEPIDPTVMAQLVAASVQVLEGTVAGDHVTIRVQPPGRDVTATLVARSGDAVHSREFSSSAS